MLGRPETILDTLTHEKLWELNKDLLQQHGINKKEMAMLKIKQPGFNYVILANGYLSVGKQVAGGDYSPLEGMTSVPYNIVKERFDEEGADESFSSFVEREYENIMNEVETI